MIDRSQTRLSFSIEDCSRYLMFPYLLQFERGLDFWSMLVDVALKSDLVNRLSHHSRHNDYPKLEPGEVVIRNKNENNELATHTCVGSLGQLAEVSVWRRLQVFARKVKREQTTWSVRRARFIASPKSQVSGFLSNQTREPHSGASKTTNSKNYLLSTIPSDD